MTRESPRSFINFGWVDRGEPVEPGGGGPRSCRTYVPSVRHCLRFDRAYELGRSLDATKYTERYCGCTFCAEAFANGQHPLDLLLEQQIVTVGSIERRTPTARAVALNTWHHLLSRRQEIEAFSEQAATDVIDRDIRRAAALTGSRDTGRFRRLADELRAA